MSGFSKEELYHELCFHGILATKVPRLYKGCSGIFNNGFDWLVFLRADAKDWFHSDEPWLSSANKKFMQCNDDNCDNIRPALTPADRRDGIQSGKGLARPYARSGGTAAVVPELGPP